MQDHRLYVMTSISTNGMKGVMRVFTNRRFLYLTLLAVLALAVAGCGLFKTPVPTKPTEFTVSYNLAGIPNEPIPNVEGASTLAQVKPMLLTRGAGVGAFELTNGFSANGWNRPNPSLTVALDEDMYFQFGFTVDKGFTVALETLDLWLRRSALHAPMNYALYVSLDGFKDQSVEIATFTYLGRTSGTAPSPDPTEDDPFYYMTNDLPGRPNTTSSVGDPIPTIDLSAVSILQEIPGGTTVTPRLIRTPLHSVV